MVNIKYAYVRYQENKFATFNKFEIVPISAVYEFENSEDYIKPASDADFLPNHRYWIRLCVCDNEDDACDDLSTCVDYEKVKGYIIMLAGRPEDIVQNALPAKRQNIKPKKNSSTESEDNTHKKMMQKNAKALHAMKLSEEVQLKTFCEQGSIVTKNFSEEQPKKSIRIKKQIKRPKIKKQSKFYTCHHCQMKFASKSFIAAHMKACMDKHLHDVPVTPQLNATINNNANGNPSGSLSYRKRLFQDNSVSASITVDVETPERTHPQSAINIQRVQVNLHNEPTMHQSINASQHGSPESINNELTPGNSNQSISRNNNRSQNHVPRSGRNNRHSTTVQQHPSGLHRLGTHGVRIRRKKTDVGRKGRHFKEEAILKAIKHFVDNGNTDAQGTRGQIINGDQIYLGEGVSCNYDSYLAKKHKKPKTFFRFLVNQYWSPETLAYRCQDKKKTYVQLEGGPIQLLTPEKKRLLYSLYNDHLKKVYTTSERRMDELLKVNMYYSEMIRNARLEHFEPSTTVDHETVNNEDLSGIEEFPDDFD